jgi:nucleoside-diphosphate-sugar epimerase
MRKHVTLITGAGGEIGHGLIERLADEGGTSIITIDLKPLDHAFSGLVEQEYRGSILETHLLDRILSEYQVETIYHLAAILSTRAEFTPVTAHQVNVEGTLKLLDFAQAQGESHGHTVVFLYPSSIAAYGLPDLETKAAAGAVREHEWNNPTTMYGCNKLYCEHLGRYFALHYKQLAAETLSGKVDFRAIRFPGLISAVTVPSGGTSDFAPEMIHAAARGEPYACFVRPDTRIPFMVMPDAVDGLVRLARAERARLGRSSTAGRQTWMTVQRDPTGGSARAMTSRADSMNFSSHEFAAGTSLDIETLKAGLAPQRPKVAEMSQLQTLPRKGKSPRNPKM